LFWYEGQAQAGDRLSLRINDPGLLYGATVFTTMRVYGRSLAHRLTHWQAHCDRLCQSLEDFHWSNPDWRQVQAGAELLATEYLVLRITLFPDGREWIVGRDLPPDLTRRQRVGIRGWVAREDHLRRSLPQYKTGNYLGAWLAMQKAQSFGAQEAILIDEAGNWLETTTGTLWGWRDGTWYTPQINDNFLPGIVRSQLMSWLARRQISFKETVWTPEFVKTLSLVAYTNSVVEMVPFQEILLADGNQYTCSNFAAIEDLKHYFEY